MAQDAKHNITVTWCLPVTHRDYNRMSASVWIRCLQLLPYLEEQGVACQVNAPEAEADIVVFVRNQDEAAYQLAKRQKAKGCKIVFDLCVNYFDETGLFPGGYGTGPERVEEARRMVELCDVVTCASQNIADRAQDFHPWVEYVSDSIDVRHFSQTKSCDDFERPHIRAIWSGYHAKALELEPILPLLKQRGIALTLITDQAPPLKYAQIFWKRTFPYRFMPWHYETFPQAILQGECCLSFRSVDNPYNRGHSVFKIGAFMAQGVPAIVSPLPSYVEAIGVAQTGRVCHSLQEWKQTLDRVIDDQTLLKTWSQRAHIFRERYSTETIVRQYQEIFQKLCA